MDFPVVDLPLLAFLPLAVYHLLVCYHHQGVYLPLDVHHYQDVDQTPHHYQDVDQGDGDFWGVDLGVHHYQGAH